MLYEKPAEVKLSRRNAQDRMNRIYGMEITPMRSRGGELDSISRKT
jgi:hypothetical protein